MKLFLQNIYVYAFFLLLGCNSQDTLRVIDVYTGEASVVENNAQIPGVFQNTIINVDYDGDVTTGSQKISDHGHCWSTDSLPTLSNNLLSLGAISQSDTFYTQINSLAANTIYFARAFVIADNTIYYGNTVSFNTGEDIVEEEPEEEEEEEEEEPEVVSYWTEKGNYPSFSSGSYSGFTLGNYFIAGLSTDYDENRKFWRYNTDTDNWKQIASFNGTSVTDAVMMSYNNKGYLIGGNRLGFGSLPTDQFYEYDSEKNEWDDLDDFRGRARRFAMGFRLENKIYYGLGEKKSDIWIYDIEDEKWKELKKGIPKELDDREYATTFTYANKAYVGFGKDKNYRNDLWSFDPNSEEWNKMSDFPGSGRIVNCLFVINGAAYFIGGSNGNQLAENWKYVIAENRWQKLDDKFDLLDKVAFGLSVNNKGYGIFTSEKSFWRFDAPVD
jgi:hypothetical protein